VRRAETGPWCRRALSALVLVTITIAGCRVLGNDVVKVRVIVEAAAQGRQVSDLDLVAGSATYSWPGQKAGATRDVNLLPGPEDDRQLFFSYKFDGEKRYWDGPKIPMGSGYRMEITIDASGRVSSRHCILPCTLS
jgi:hypothetical protein